MNLLRYAGSNSNRKHSPALWRDAPLLEVMLSQKDGVFFTDDFEAGIWAPSATVVDAATLIQGRYRAYSSTGGAIGIGEAGVFGSSIDMASDGDNEGAAMLTSGTPFLITQNGGDLWFEARLKTSTIADTKHGIFLGFCEGATMSATVPIAADGTLADQNLLGFWRLEGDGDKMDVAYKANGVTAVIVAADAVTLVADTWIKVGFRYRSATKKLSYWINGVEQSTTKTIPNATGTDFPADVAMGLCFAVLNATATTPGSTKLDWWSCLQLDAGE